MTLLAGMRYRLRNLRELLVVVPTILGAIIGSVVFAPVVEFLPLAPRESPIVAAALGGIPGMAIGLILYFLIPHRPKT